MATIWGLGLLRHSTASTIFRNYFHITRSRSLELASPLLREELAPPLLATSTPIAAVSTIHSLVNEIWESILRAVPKKKTSHMKKRHRQMAGKALKDVTFVVKCSGCGRPKRAHILCPYCVQSVKSWFKGDTAKISR